METVVVGGAVSAEGGVAAADELVAPARVALLVERVGAAVAEGYHKTKY